MPLFTNEDVVSGAVDANITNPSIPVTGPLTDAELRATAVSVLGPLTDAQLRATPVPVSTSVTTASSSTVTLVVSTGSNQTLLSANAARKKAILFFENSTFYVKLGATAASNSYTYKVGANATLIEIPSEWTGRIDAIGTASKNILVTELF